MLQFLFLTEKDWFVLLDAITHDNLGIKKQNITLSLISQCCVTSMYHFKAFFKVRTKPDIRFVTLVQPYYSGPIKY